MPIKNTTCWIITEGIAGTENQCLGLAEALGALSPVDITVKRVKLRFPWKQLTPYLRLGNHFALSNKGDEISSPYPDIAICSGRKSIPAALKIKQESKGKTFVVFLQDPKCPTSLFDLVIAGEHDDVKGANVIQTTGALNRITAEKLTSAAMSLKTRLPPEFNAPFLSVLIGGKSRTHDITQSDIRVLANHLDVLSEKYSILVTASRRTGEENLAFLKEQFGYNPKIYLWDGTGENPYFGFLGISETILVTSDSISMISDALTAGKPTYIISLRGENKRFDSFYESIIDKGLAKYFDGHVEPWVTSSLLETKRCAEIIYREFVKRRNEEKKERS